MRARLHRNGPGSRRGGDWLASCGGAGREEEEIRRLMFTRDYEEAVQEALKHPVEIDARMVDAQQARRVLDRLSSATRYSPLLWDKVRRGLSAGRVRRWPQARRRSRNADSGVCSGRVLASVRPAWWAHSPGVRREARQDQRRSRQVPTTTKPGRISRRSRVSVLSFRRSPPRNASGTRLRLSLRASFSRRPVSPSRRR